MRALALGHAHAPSTSATYSSALHSYISFCQNHGFPIEPTADSLSFYIVYMSSHIQPTSIKSYLSGIQSQLETYFPNICTLCHSHIVSCTLWGCKWLYNSDIRRKHPIQPEDLHRLIDHYASSTSHDNFLFVAQATSGFHALNHLGELVWLDMKALQSYRNVPLCHSIRWHDHALSYLLPCHKADPFFEGNWLYIQQPESSIDAYQPFL
jgi:hypothetical protein